MIDYTVLPIKLPFDKLEKLKNIMKIADIASSMSTCSRREVGAVITDIDLRVLSLGYNGRKKGLPHCKNTNPDKLKEACNCIHAEQNAFAFDVHPKSIERLVFVTTFPCDSCMKLLAANNVKAIYYKTEYVYFEKSLEIAIDNNIFCYKLSI